MVAETSYEVIDEVSLDLVTADQACIRS